MTFSAATSPRVTRALRPVLMVVLALGLGAPAVGAEVRTRGAWSHAVDAEPRYGHVAVRLHDGRVLVAGGIDDNGDGLLATADVFDPTTGVTPTENMSAPRYQPAAALLGDGSVLVTGGYGGAQSADRYVPVLDRWIQTPTMSSPRWGHTATLLTDGRILVAGGGRADDCCEETTLTSDQKVSTRIKRRNNYRLDYAVFLN